MQILGRVFGNGYRIFTQHHDWSNTAWPHNVLMIKTHHPDPQFSTQQRTTEVGSPLHTRKGRGGGPMHWLRWICLNLRGEVPKQRKKKSCQRTRLSQTFSSPLYPCVLPITMDWEKLLPAVPDCIAVWPVGLWRIKTPLVGLKWSR